jgi:hypothetical protein
VTSVEVIQTGGRRTFARATADEFESGVLTVTWLDPENAQYGPAWVTEDWVEVWVLGADGHPDFSFTNNRAWSGHRQTRELHARATEDL